MGRLQKGHLHKLLQGNASLKRKGFTFSCTQSGGIVIDRWGHVHGIWEYDGSSYSWTTPSCSEPMFTTDSPNSAVVYTLVALTQIDDVLN